MNMPCKVCGNTKLPLFTSYKCPDCECLVERQLRDALDLTDGDFAYHESDLYVVAKPEVFKWLRENYKFYSNVSTFVSPEGSGWNGAGKRCIEIPFVRMDSLLAEKKHAKRIKE